MFGDQCQVHYVPCFVPTTITNGDDDFFSSTPVYTYDHDYDTPTMITAAPLETRTIVLDPRSVTLPPTQSSGVSASNVITETHSHRQKKAPVGIIVGVALAIVVALFGLFFIRFLFIRRARRREAFAGPGKTLGGGPVPGAVPQAQSRGSMSKGPIPPPQSQNYPNPNGMPMPSERDAVELGQYPPPSNSNYSAPNPSVPAQPTHNPSGSWPTAFSSGAGAASVEPGAGSSPAARQAYLAAELRAAQAQLERGGKSVNTKEVKARIRALEERQQSAWALGLE